MENLLEVKNLSKTFITHHLDKVYTPVKDISFSVKEGNFLGIVGKSGSGKSTIIKCIYRTYLTTEGEINYNSNEFGLVDLSKLEERKVVYLRKHEIGYVSQFLNVMPRTTCLELVTNSLLEVGEKEDKAIEIAKDTLRFFDMPESLWNSYPNTFSGGEKLRLNISTAVVRNPRLLLLDEPTASLDNESKLKVRETIEKLKNTGTTLIGIFHDLEFMDGLTDSIFDMQKNEVKYL